MLKLCQSVFDGKRIENEYVSPKGKGGVKNCNAYRGIKLFKHAMRIVERVLERRIREVVNVDGMQFGFMPDRGTTVVLFIFGRVQEKYREEDICVLWIL